MGCRLSKTRAEKAMEIAIVNVCVPWRWMTRGDCSWNKGLRLGCSCHHAHPGRKGGVPSCKDKKSHLKHYPECAEVAVEETNPSLISVPQQTIEKKWLVFSA